MAASGLSQQALESMLNGVQEGTTVMMDANLDPNLTYSMIVLPLHFVTDITDAEITYHQQKVVGKGDKQRKTGTTTVIPSRKYAKMVMAMQSNGDPIALTFEDPTTFGQVCQNFENSLCVGEATILCPVRCTALAYVSCH